MPPKQASGGARGRPKGSKSNRTSTAAAATADSPASSNPFESSDDQGEDDDNGNMGAAGRRRERNAAAAEEPAPDKTIPRELLTRVLHEFFAKDATRISRDANAAVGKYVDVFVREAIARAAVDKRGGFLEVSKAVVRYAAAVSDGWMDGWRRGSWAC
ncbi:hypothetical protein O9K51_05408 [Purpureocillium lavendulum]|uniref:Uncharacterized protein n=1 Tax=Purpureocillium lavendulum TaxID=1247861 RepID=A0AB34FTZ5_9HYPO|nr:hypothetical protein O9K51_05408 [Purpureocillium lavendulum]